MGSIRTDPPPRWSDQAGADSSATKDAVTRALESRFGLAQPSQDTHSSAGGTLSASSSAAPAPGTDRGRTQATAASPKHVNMNEVLEPHTLPPGSAPDEQASAMQDFCGSADGNWGPVVGAHLSPCFIHAFLFAFVDLAFVIAACVRLRAILSLPAPPPRALSRNHIFRVIGCSLVAIYNLVMFAAHLAYDYGAPYQWLMYPVSCLSWSLSVLLIITEARYAAPCNWVSKSFWISSLVVASLLLWTSLADDKLRASHDLAPFILHYCLYAAMAAMAVFLSDDAQDYGQLALDISEISLDDDVTAQSHDEQSLLAQQGKGSRSRWGGSEAKAHARRVMRLLAEDKWLGGGALACCFVGAPIEIVQFVYAGMVVDECAVPEGPSAIADYMAVLVALYLIQGVSAASQLILTSIVGERLAARLRRAAFHSLVHQDVLYVEGGRSEELVGSIEFDVERMQEACTRQLCQVAQSVIQAIVGLAFMVLLSWKLTLVAVAMVPIGALLMLVQTTVLQSYSRRSLDALNALTALATEVLGAWATVRSFAKEGREKVRFGQEALSAYSLCWRMGLAHGVADGIGVLVVKLCLVLALFYGGSLVHHNDLSGGILVSYSLIALQVVMALSVLPPVLADITNAFLAGRSILDLIDRQPDVNAKGGLTLPSCEGRLEFRAVSFSYPSQPDLAALNDVSFVLEPGAHAAFFGTHGAGKSTVLALVERFFDCAEGLVLLDDTDISTYDPSWLHYQIALVSQEPVVFATSVAENITMGQSGARTAVEAAGRKSGLDEHVSSLPDGYDAQLGLYGHALSPAGKRALAVARVLMKDARILLLDAPTASLSPAEAAKVTRGLQEAMKGRTTLSVSSAPEPFQADATHVGVLNKGSLVEFGRPAELQRGDSAYKRLLERGGWEAGGKQEGGSGGSVGGRGDTSRSGGLLEGLERQLALAGPEEGPALAELRATIAQYKRT